MRNRKASHKVNFCVALSFDEKFKTGKMAGNPCAAQGSVEMNEHSREVDLDPSGGIFKVTATVVVGKGATVHKPALSLPSLAGEHPSDQRRGLVH